MYVRLPAPQHTQQLLLPDRKQRGRRQEPACGERKGGGACLTASCDGSYPFRCSSGGCARIPSSDVLWSTTRSRYTVWPSKMFRSKKKTITTIIKKTTKTILLSAINKGSSCTDAGRARGKRGAEDGVHSKPGPQAKKEREKGKASVNSAPTLEKAEGRCKWWLE